MRILISFAICFGLFLSQPALAQETAPVPAPVAAPAVTPAPVPEKEHRNPFVDPVPAAAETTTSAAVSTIPHMPPANPEPLEDYTKYYARQTATVSSNGQPAEFTYFLFSPEKPWVEGAKYPLVLVLHSATGVGEAGILLIREATRKKFPAFVLVPALPEGKRWIDSGSPKPAHALSEAIQIVKQVEIANPAIDTSRVYVIGCGSGGNGAYGAAQNYSDVFAAVVPIAAAWNPHESSNMKNVPIAAFHGADDQVVPYLSSMDTVTMIKRSGGAAFFTKYDNLQHDCYSDRIYNDLLWQWIFSQKKK